MPTLPPDMVEADRYLNRDLSWLEFNRRVLAQALDTTSPLLERVKFLAIFASNLDEFFMKRVGLLKRRRAAGGFGSQARPGELAPDRTLAEIRRIVLEMQDLQERCFAEDVRPALARAGIHILDYTDLSEHERHTVDAWFNANVFPVLTPLAVDPGHRFPFISNLSENLGVLLEPADPSATRHGSPNPHHLFARVKIPTMLPQFVRLDTLDTAPGAEPAPPDASARSVRLVPLDEIVRHNLDELFPGLRIIDVLPFRITRSAAIEVDDEEVEDLLEQVETEIRARRFASALRIQVGPNPNREILGFVMDELDLRDDDVYERVGPLAYADLFEIASLDRPDLKDKPWKPVVPRALPADETSIFDRIAERDILVHHPYESFEDSVERFIAEAARDPDVLAIKQTLYRTSRDSPFVDSLIEAATEGKQVACLVELRARFDEETNVNFARQLEAAGVHVAYGVVGFKTHCKCSLVVRREREGARATIRTYCHIGTGNYHPGTAQLYTDLGLFTRDPAITSDVVRLFNALTGHTANTEYQRLLVAPDTLRPGFNDLIDAEIANARAGKPARIVAKMNSLEDRKITDRLYDASQAGVQVHLYVRGFCCLRPGVPGVSDNIAVTSVIGRFLEHSRIFHFADGHDDPLDGRFLIGSSDWMYRNLNNRVEACAPVDDRDARARLWNILEILRRDRRSAWRLTPAGVYDKLAPPEGADPASPEALGTFAALMADARAR
ncbi:MAG: polyphosphate kinase 1 [Phycisphaerales bacterium]